MPAPEISGQSWLNSGPMQIAELKGKVVLVEFWTFGCHNCRNVEPYIKAWHQKYADRGLVIIGVHAPEFSYERSVTNVQRYVREHAIPYPVAIDNDIQHLEALQQSLLAGPVPYRQARDHSLSPGGRRGLSTDRAKNPSPARGTRRLLTHLAQAAGTWFLFGTTTI